MMILKGISSAMLPSPYSRHKSILCSGGAIIAAVIFCREEEFFASVFALDILNDKFVTSFFSGSFFSQCPALVSLAVSLYC